MNIKANLPFSSYITYLNPNTSVIRDDSYIMEIFITFIPIISTFSFISILLVTTKLNKNSETKLLENDIFCYYLAS